jgi:hypothetical protein
VCILLNIFCSRLTFINWLQNHLPRCPFKYLTGIDCPGCGFQRSVISLFNGNLRQSFQLYPATIPLLLLFGYAIADGVFKLDSNKGTTKKVGAYIAGSIVIISYIVKMWGLYHHYTTAA